MIKSKFQVFKYQLQQGLLLIALTFSVFAFSGYNQQVHATLAQPAQTELTDARSSKPVFNYGSFDKLCDTDNGILIAGCHFNTPLLLRNDRFFDCLIKVKFEAFKRKASPFSTLRINLQRRASYNSSDEDISVFPSI